MSVTRQEAGIVTLPQKALAVCLLLSMLALVTSSPSADGQELTTITSLQTITTSLTSLQFATVAEQQDYVRDPFKIPPAPPSPATTCSVVSEVSFHANSGDRMDTSVRASSEVELAILDRESASFIMGNLNKPSSPLGLSITCVVLELGVSRSGIYWGTNYGTNFSSYWQANRTDNYDLLFVNWRTTEITVQFRAVLTSFSHATATFTPIVTRTLTHVGAAPRYIYLLSENALPIVFVTLILVAAAAMIVVRRRRKKAKKG